MRKTLLCIILLALTGCYVQFTLSDLPNFSKASAEVDARIISVEEGYGAPDETTDILDQLGEQLYYGAKLIWHLFEVSEEELP